MGSYNEIIQQDPVALKWIKRPTWEEAEMIGGVLFSMAESINFWISDYINMCEALFPQNYTQLLPFGLAAKSISNIKWVGRKIPPSRRLPELSWSHHEAVSGLESETDQDIILEQAASGQWTVSQVREKVREVKGEKPKTVKQAKTIVCPECGHIIEIERV
jgi:hypothetical protein